MQDDGRIRGDSVLTFPSLARLRVTLSGGRLTITDDGEVVVTAGLDPTGRHRLADAVADWVLVKFLRQLNTELHAAAVA